MQLSEADDIQIQQQKHYGRLNPICIRNNQPKYFLGPQFKFFILNFFLVLTIEILLQVITTCFIFFRIIAITLNIMLLIFMIILGLSNPGLAVQYPYKSNLSNGYCSRCNTQQYRGVRHCQKCDVCIAEFDHHCTFMGKCIGKGNHSLFKMFLILVITNLCFMMMINTTGKGN